MIEAVSEPHRRALAQRVGQLREARHLSQVALARLANTSQGQIADTEVAQQNVTLESIVRLANALGVTALDLFGPDPRQLHLEHAAILLHTAAAAIDDEIADGEQHLNLEAMEGVTRIVLNQMVELRGDEAAWASTDATMPLSSN